MESKGNSIKWVYIIIAIVSINFFLLLGYEYPATKEDIAQNKVFPFNSTGKYDRGMYNQFFTSFAFLGSLLILGFYVVSTFVRFGIKNWTLFAFGVYLMYLYGLGKIGELVYDHGLFDEIKDIILPIALTVFAIATYKISSDFKRGR